MDKRPTWTIPTGSELVGVPLDRVVAVVADLPGGLCQIGTGFVIDGHRVLTAEHCTRDKVTGLKATRLQVVRASDGRVVDTDTVIADPMMDVAVVTLRDPAWPIDLPPVACARVRRNETGVLTDCHGIGYPLFQRDPEQRSRGTAEFHGTLYQTDERETGHLLIREPLITPGPLPDDHRESADLAPDDTAAPSPWGGLSGALVFHRGRAIGVVVEHHPRQGSNAIRILAIDRLATDPTFAAALHLPAVEKVPFTVADPLAPVSSPAAPRRQVSWPVSIGCPPPLASAFQQRPAILDQIKQADSAVVLRQVMSGDGGVGKSQMAAGVYHSSTAAARMWVSADSRTAIITGYTEAAVGLDLADRDSGPDELARVFLGFLAATDKSSLVP